MDKSTKNLNLCARAHFMRRRKFLMNVPLVYSLPYIASSTTKSISARALPESNDSSSERKYWLDTMQLIAEPVLFHLAKNTLKKNLPVLREDRRSFGCLEAFARTLAGIAPWLELGKDQSEEGILRARYTDLCLKGLENSTNPLAADYMNFKGEKASQPLVDASFLAYSLLLAPKVLWEGSNETVKANIIKALQSASVIEPLQSNWLLFSAMIEVALLRFSKNCNLAKIEDAFKKFDVWYKGDGWYGDGENFHIDYYNSIVIQPFMMKIVFELEDVKRLNENAITDSLNNILRNKEKYLKIGKQHAAHLEMMISSDGSFLPIGRSITYRFGAFHHLSFMALHNVLPINLSPAQVRSALTAVIKKIMESKANFDKNGWLQLGLYGHQPLLAESYIDIGSLYLCMAVFQALGIEGNDIFWKGPSEFWTQKKIWSGENVATIPYLKN